MSALRSWRVRRYNPALRRQLLFRRMLAAVAVIGTVAGTVVLLSRVALALT